MTLVLDAVSSDDTSARVRVSGERFTLLVGQAARGFRLARLTAGECAGFEYDDERFDICTGDRRTFP